MITTRVHVGQRDDNTERYADFDLLPRVGEVVVLDEVDHVVSSIFHRVTEREVHRLDTGPTLATRGRAEIAIVPVTTEP